MFIPKIDDNLKIWTDNEVKGSAVINFSWCFKSKREKLYSKLKEEQNLWKVVESLFIFLTTPDELHKYDEMMQESSSDN